MLACSLKGLNEFGTNFDGKTVYRVSGDFAAKSLSWRTPTSVISDPAFYSTSNSDKYYKRTENTFSHAYRFKFTLKTPSKCRGVYAGQNGDRPISSHGTEEEVLCAPNTQFRVTSATQENVDKCGAAKVWTIEATEM